jgi:ComF family protein
VRLVRWFADLLSPLRCAACNEPVAGRRAFCPPCAASVERADAAPDVVAFGQYGGALARAIQRFKYEDRPDLAVPLGSLLYDVCQRTKIRATLVVPVPLHSRRLAARGYNQSALLGHHVARALGVPLVTRALQRIVDTVAQVELPRDARATNVESAFRASPARLRDGPAIALVDDVSTTGATLRACRHALIVAGATRVTSVVVARTTGAPLGISSGDRLEQRG